MPLAPGVRPHATPLILVRRDEDAPSLVAIVHPEVSTLRGQRTIVGHELVLEVREEGAVDGVVEESVVLIRQLLVVRGTGRDPGHTDGPPVIVHGDIPNNRGEL